VNTTTSMYNVEKGPISNMLIVLSLGLSSLWKNLVKQLLFTSQCWLLIIPVL